MSHEVLSIREAARRVNRSRKTVQRWLRDGLPYHQRPGDRTKWIHLADLQSTFVSKLEARWAHNATGKSGRFGTVLEAPQEGATRPKSEETLHGRSGPCDIF